LWHDVLGFEYVVQKDDKKTLEVIMSELHMDFMEFELRVTRYIKDPPRYSGKFKVKYGVANFHKEVNRYGGRYKPAASNDWKQYYEDTVKGE
jgi:hypothetical protein